MSTEETSPGIFKNMRYEYSGYLGTVLHKPDPSLAGKQERVVFTADDLAKWTLYDRGSAQEWKQIPASRRRTEEGVELRGGFEDVRRISNLAPGDTRYWVPLGTLDWKDDRLPIDTARFPIMEVTYRCTTPNVRLAWMWQYPGGLYHDNLPYTQEWTTVSRLIRQFDFPEIVDDLIFRLYSPSRTTETAEIHRVVFRAMSPEEREACTKNEARLLETYRPKSCRVLQDFLPFGVYLNGDILKNLAVMLGLSVADYLSFVMEDIVKHNHNCIVLSHVDKLGLDDFQTTVDQATRFGLRLAVCYGASQSLSIDEHRERIRAFVEPYADNDTVFAWGLCDNPAEERLEEILALKSLFEAAAPDKPTYVITQHPNAFPLFAPFFSAIGIGHDSSHDPWEVGSIVQHHEPLVRGRHFWLRSPAFIYATETPEWSSCPEMRLMVNQAFVNGSKGWFSYLYHNEPLWLRGYVQRSLTGSFLTFSDIWEELGLRMERLQALAPLLLQSQPRGILDKWFLTSCIAHQNSKLPDGIPPAWVYQLDGANHTLYGVVSNDMREMTSVSLHIPEKALKDREIFDLTDYIPTRQWEPMVRKKHLEMFPGQMHMMLVASPDICDYWRDVIATRIIENDRRKTALRLELARKYDIDCRETEEIMAGMGSDSPYQHLQTMRRAKHILMDRIYDTPELCNARTKIIEASAAICGCDGALCRMFGRGGADAARELGQEVLPLVRELSHLRLELREGHGDKIFKASEGLARKSVQLLEKLRAAT